MLSIPQSGDADPASHIIQLEEAEQPLQLMFSIMRDDEEAVEKIPLKDFEALCDLHNKYEMHAFRFILRENFFRNVGREPLIALRLAAKLQDLTLARKAIAHLGSIYALQEPTVVSYKAGDSRIWATRTVVPQLGGLNTLRSLNFVTAAAVVQAAWKAEQEKHKYTWDDIARHFVFIESW